MTTSDLAFLVGPLAGPLVAAGSCAIVIARTRRPQVILPTAGLSLVLLVSFVTYWFLWGTAFDAVDTLRAVPVRVERALDVSMAVCALAATALAALAVVVLAFGPRRARGGVGAPGTS